MGNGIRHHRCSWLRVDGFWVFMYTAPSKNKFVNSAELEYIEQDKHETYTATVKENEEKKSMTFRQCFTYRQTWAFAFGKFMTDGVWWFFLFGHLLT